MQHHVALLVNAMKLEHVFCCIILSPVRK
jgi:hypothetical protein